MGIQHMREFINVGHTIVRRDVVVLEPWVGEAEDMSELMHKDYGRVRIGIRRLVAVRRAFDVYEGGRMPGIGLTAESARRVDPADFDVRTRASVIQRGYRTDHIPLEGGSPRATTPASARRILSSSAF